MRGVVARGPSLNSGVAARRVPRPKCRPQRVVVSHAGGLGVASCALFCVCARVFSPNLGQVARASFGAGNRVVSGCFFWRRILFYSSVRKWE